MGNVTKFNIDKIKTTPPLEWQDLIIKASFGENAVQPNITPLEFTMVGDANKRCREHVQGGLSGGVGIFEGLDYSATVENVNGQIEFINGYLDFADGYSELGTDTVNVKAKLKEGLLSLDELTNSITFDYLLANGDIQESDFVKIPFIVEKRFNETQIALLSVVLAMMINHIATQIEKLAEDISTFVALVSVPPTGSAGAIVFQGLIIIARTAYITIMSKQIYELASDLFSYFYSPVRIEKGMRYRRMLEIGFNNLGFQFQSSISELDLFVYDPSKTEYNKNQSGIPRARDYGNLFSEFVSVCKKMFGANIGVENNIVYLERVNSDFWVKKSTLKMPKVLIDGEYPKTYNTDDLNRSFIVQYDYDYSDKWTIDNYRGTTYTVITSPNIFEDITKLTLKGYQRIDIPFALGSRKNGLTDIEKAMKVVFLAIDEVIEVFGGSSDFAGKIENRKGMLKKSDETHSIAKVLPLLANGHLPSNHRDLCSAKYLWQNGINERSFVANNFKRQRINYKDVVFGFGLSDYKNTINNSYFYTPDGRIGKFTGELEWSLEKDEAKASFWIEEIYTRNLYETEIEPS